MGQYYEISIQCADGTTRWYELSFWPTVPDGLIGILHDIRRPASENLPAAGFGWFDVDIVFVNNFHQPAP